MITSPDNDKLKTIRKLARRRERERTGLFVAEGEDLVAAAAAAGARTEFVLVAGEDVEPELLDSVSTLGSGTRVIGVYGQAWSEVPGGPGAPGGVAAEAPALSLYLYGVGDPGNVGSAIRSAHALCDGPVILGPGCADPYSPKAVRASMGSIFARPPARAEPSELPGSPIALSTAARARRRRRAGGSARGAGRGRRDDGSDPAARRRPGFPERRDGGDRWALRDRT
jgi:RNA methyltransferase, TrmH family